MENYDFEVTRAYHEKAASYDEMAEAREKMNRLQASLGELYKQIGELQQEYDSVKAEQDSAWSEYSSKRNSLTAKIGEKITSGKEAAALEENLTLMAEREGEEPAKAVVYRKGAEFFAKLNRQNLLERDELISRKRGLIRPESSKAESLLVRLKQLRADQDDMIEKYHIAKNDFALKRSVFERSKAKYEAARNPQFSNLGDAPSSRPQKIFSKDLLLLAGVPEENWETCSMEQRVDGRVDIYYGSDTTHSHGHVVIYKNNVEYHREPQAIQS